MGDQDEHPQEVHDEQEDQDFDEASLQEQELLTQFTATTEDGTQIVLTAEQLQSYQEAMEAQGVETQLVHEVGDVGVVDESEVDPDAQTQLLHMEGVDEGDPTQELVEGQHYVETQTIIDEHGNPQTVVTGASLQDLLTLHAVDADGNFIAAENHVEGAEGVEHLVTEDGQPLEAYEEAVQDEMQIHQDNGTGEMMDTSEIIEEVIPSSEHNDEQIQNYEIDPNDHYIDTTEEVQEPEPENIDSKAGLLTQPFLSVRDSVFNPVTGTLQPISSLTPMPATPTSPIKPKKEKTQQVKYVIQQAGGDGQAQQFVLNADQLQGLLQGTGNALSSGQKILIASSTSKVKSRSPTKILPAPVPIGDQLQPQNSSPGTQKILLKSGNKYISIPSGPATPGTTQLIQIPGPGGKVQYLRVVPNKTQSIAPLNKIAIAPMTSKPKQAIQLAPKPSGGQTFIIPSGTSANDLAGLTGLSSSGLSNYFVLPNYFIKTEKTSEQAQAEATMLALQQNLAQTQAGFESFRSLLEPNGMRPRKPCNCTKSQCLKLYCDCFANGEFCHLCNCTNCYNNLNHEEDRQKAIKMVLERNPGAFRPKIGKSSQTGEAHERRHNKGCNCRRSGCLKNYCECYEAKIFCSGICKCSGCKNCIENIPTGLPNGVGVEQHFAGAGTSHRQTLKDLAEAAEVRVQQQNQVRNKMKAQWQEVSTQNNLGAMVPPCVFRYPHGTISYEVVTSSVELLIARSESAEKQRATDGDMEKLVLEEFGECLSSLMELGISPTTE